MQQLSVVFPTNNDDYKKGTLKAINLSIVKEVNGISIQNIIA